MMVSILLRTITGMTRVYPQSPEPRLRAGISSCACVFVRLCVLCRVHMRRRTLSPAPAPAPERHHRPSTSRHVFRGASPPAPPLRFSMGRHFVPAVQMNNTNNAPVQLAKKWKAAKDWKCIATTQKHRLRILTGNGLTTIVHTAIL